MKKIEVGCIAEIIRVVGFVVPAESENLIGEEVLVLRRSLASDSVRWQVKTSDGLRDVVEPGLRRIDDDSESDWLDAALSTPAYDPAADREYKSNPLDVPAPKEAEKA